MMEHAHEAPQFDRKVELNRMESLAATGIAYRFQREIDDARQARDEDILKVFVEHGCHGIPANWAVVMDRDGNVTHLVWDVRNGQSHSESNQEPNHAGD